MMLIIDKNKNNYYNPFMFWKQGIKISNRISDNQAKSNDYLINRASRNFLDVLVDHLSWEKSYDAIVNNSNQLLA